METVFVVIVAVVGLCWGAWAAFHWAQRRLQGCRCVYLPGEGSDMEPFGLVYESSCPVHGS